MCGITGFVDFSGSSRAEELTWIAGSMTNAISHRGPDDHGAWVDAEAGVALGFRRLAILDLSPTGHQPMVSDNGEYVIVFNGEIYNFVELRDELAALGYIFRGHSDTEIMLAAFHEWGLEKAVQCFNGMFAFALWHRPTRQLHLVRDRLGIKPLYFGWMGNVFLFGSELKALRSHPAFSPDIDRDALTLYMRHAYIPAPYSIYHNVWKLQPGSILTLDRARRDPSIQPRCYWSAHQVAEDGQAHLFEGSEQEAVDALDALLRDSVSKRMVADVPLGAFLSGGVDSSTVVALMQAQSTRPVKTFTIGFHEAGFDEAAYARTIARYLGTEHTELYVTPQEAQAVIPLLPALYDEPFADSSQIPTYLVSQLARRQVTVSLSGDGGDELFGGYDRYFLTRRIWSSIGWLPVPERKMLGALMTGSAGAMERLNRLLPRHLHLANLRDKVLKLVDVIQSSTIEQTYFDLISLWKQPETIVRQGHEPLTMLQQSNNWPDLGNPTHWMMFADLVTYLPDDILVKLDRATMGVSLEGRVPFLDDHRVVEFAWRLPFQFKVRGRTGKWILRQVLYRYIPQEMIERPKMGFGVPIDSWLRGSLREWAETLLDSKRLEREGILDPLPIRRKWSEHIRGERNWQYLIWNVLMLQSWLEAQG
ncbi:MAG: asparagine synthase (glutamine-hydrolyzing) [Chloroflexi bacterium]|nr:asparagine synthase (glutamine-hydrolyzing) [Chloroflexota bacterium]